MSGGIAFAGMARQADMVRNGDVTPTELTDLYLERIERLDSQINSYRVVLADQARAEARRVEERLAAGEDLPLAGVPVALKDVEDVAGEVTAWGSRAFDEPAAADNEVVSRLRAAGAVMLGKTNLPELAIYGFTESEAFGITRNPWQPRLTPGGSSGGAGAALAAGLCAGASASDGAGSIRIPAALCGLFGLKPQRNRIPLTARGDHWYGLSVTGALTRTVADSALWLDVCQDGAPGGPPAPQRSFTSAAGAAPGALRIAYSVKAPRLIAPAIVSDEVKGAVHETATLLRSLGHQVEARDPDWGGVGNNLQARYLAGIAQDVENAPHPERLEKRTRGFRPLGRAYRGRLLNRARRNEAKDARRILSIFDRCDVLMTPVTGAAAVPVGRWNGQGALRTVLGMSRTYPFCAPWNHLGNPAASVPAGFTAAGTPLAVQLIGRPNDEATLLSLAAQLEAERPWADAVPPGFE